MVSSAERVLLLRSHTKEGLFCFLSGEFCVFCRLRAKSSLGIDDFFVHPAPPAVGSLQLCCRADYRCVSALQHTSLARLRKTPPSGKRIISCFLLLLFAPQPERERQSAARKRTSDTFKMCTFARRVCRCGSGAGWWCVVPRPAPPDQTRPAFVMEIGIEYTHRQQQTDSSERRWLHPTTNSVTHCVRAALLSLLLWLPSLSLILAPFSFFLPNNAVTQFRTIHTVHPAFDTPFSLSKLFLRIFSPSELQESLQITWPHDK